MSLRCTETHSYTTASSHTKGGEENQQRVGVRCEWFRLPRCFFRSCLRCLALVAERKSIHPWTLTCAGGQGKEATHLGEDARMVGAL